MNSIQVSTRIDEVTKRRFEQVCETIGLSPSQALSIFIRGVINHNGIPFNVVAPPAARPKISRESVFGCMRGEFSTTNDFDAPLEEFQEYME